MALTGKPKEWLDSITGRLHATKRYLKTDFAVNLQSKSKVIEHCIQFALSSGEDDFSEGCEDHQHNKSCDHCTLQREVLTELEAALINMDSLQR